MSGDIEEWTEGEMPRLSPTMRQVLEAVADDRVSTLNSPAADVAAHVTLRVGGSIVRTNRSDRTNAFELTSLGREVLEFDRARDGTGA